jgi:MFS family permease
MSGIKTTVSGQQSAHFMYLYALAVCGGAVAYVPFLTMLLPARAVALSGPEALNILAIAAFGGAIAASLSNIGFGWASDVTQTRRPWILAGLILSCLLLSAMPLATNAAMLVVMIVIWQITLNMMLAPLAAWAGDCIPDAQKGMLGALSGVLVTVNGFVQVGNREIMVAIIVLCMVGPVLLFGRSEPMPHLLQSKANAKRVGEGQDIIRIAVMRMWLARLLVQIAEASLFAFLLLWFHSLDPDFGENSAASIFAIILCVAVFVALVAGRWSDRVSQPILPLIWASAVAAAGLLIMAFAPGLMSAISGYVLFGLASSVFLSLHSSQTLRVLPRPRTRGRDLGFFNLTNTLPSLIMPGLTLSLVPAYGFDALFLLLAALTLAAWVFLLTMPRR